MRTGLEVMKAVADGTPATEEELRYALHNVAVWHAMMVFDLARAINEDPVSAKTKRGLQRAWDSWNEGNKVPLDVRLKGGSYEPGVPKEELHERWLTHTTKTAVRLAETTNSIAAKQ
jgi:hypothetical protein